ncbi:MAG: UbiA family prenyltransferase [Planctomycetota bacterium]|nr:UbiA family prenyltransferase [Planctomycetota bacterium]
MLAFARLLRLSLAPSAAADVVVGVLLGYAGRWPGGHAPWLLVGASLLIYHGAMALNDWADRKEDAGTRPDRPIPSGAVSAPVARTIGWTLPAMGVALAGTISWQLAVGYLLLGACALTYDLRGRGPLRGPILLGLCRGGNLGLGMALSWTEGDLGPGAAPLLYLSAPALYAGYILCVSLLGRLEDGEGGALDQRAGRYVRGAAAALFAAPALGLLMTPTPTAGAWAASSALTVISGLWLLNAIPTGPWSQALVGKAMGRALRSTLPFSASLALLHAGDSAPARWVALGVMAAVPLSHALRRVLPPS